MLADASDVRWAFLLISPSGVKFNFFVHSKEVWPVEFAEQIAYNEVMSQFVGFERVNSCKQTQNASNSGTMTTRHFTRTFHRTLLPSSDSAAWSTITSRIRSRKSPGNWRAGMLVFSSDDRNKSYSLTPLCKKGANHSSPLRTLGERFVLQMPCRVSQINRTRCDVSTAISSNRS